jgi:hypothetical protein
VIVRPTFQNGFARHKGAAQFPTLWDALEAYWAPSLGVQGGLVRDWSPFQRHAVFTGMDVASDWVSGERGWSVECETAAGGDHLLFSGINLGQTWTMSLWYYGLAAGDNTFRDLLNPSATDLGPHVSTGNVFYYYPIALGSTIVVPGRWYHAVFTSDLARNTLKVFVNGKEDGSNSPVDSARTWDRLGRFNESTNGRFGDVGFWRRVLSNQEIADLYRGASPLVLRRVTIAKAPTAGGGQTASPGGIASAEAFGTPKVNLKVAPQAIGSAEAFGTAKLNLKVVATSISSGEAFGSATLTQGTRVLPASISSGEAFGTAKLNLQVRPTAIASAEALGSPTIVRVIRPNGIASAEAFGTTRLNLKVHLTGIPSAESFGSVIITGGGSSAPPSIDLDAVARLHSGPGPTVRSTPAPAVRSSLSAGKVT